jgi:hypothetical protein
MGYLSKAKLEKTFWEKVMVEAVEEAAEEVAAAQTYPSVGGF